MNRKDERFHMVESQIMARGISDERILDAFREVPRHLFVPEKYEKDAYRDRPLPIGNGQTISQPFIVAEMTMLLNIKKGDKVLEIGAGSGYQAAIFAHLGAEVYTIERISALINNTEGILLKLNYDVEILKGDGTLGWLRNSPYDGIVVTAAAPDAPAPLLKQLAEGGRLVIPVGSRTCQILKLYEKVNNDIRQSEHGSCMFVPLLGRYGWKEND